MYGCEFWRKLTPTKPTTETRRPGEDTKNPANHRGHEGTRRNTNRPGKDSKISSQQEKNFTDSSREATELHGGERESVENLRRDERVSEGVIHSGELQSEDLHTGRYQVK